MITFLWHVACFLCLSEIVQHCPICVAYNLWFGYDAAMKNDLPLILPDELPALPPRTLAVLGIIPVPFVVLEDLSFEAADVVLQVRGVVLATSCKNALDRFYTTGAPTTGRVFARVFLTGQN